MENEGNKKDQDKNNRWTQEKDKTMENKGNKKQKNKNNARKQEKDKNSGRKQEKDKNNGKRRKHEVKEGIKEGRQEVGLTWDNWSGRQQLLSVVSTHTDKHTHGPSPIFFLTSFVNFGFSLFILDF